MTLLDIGYIHSYSKPFPPSKGIGYYLLSLYIVRPTLQWKDYNFPWKPLYSFQQTILCCFFDIHQENGTFYVFPYETCRRELKPLYICIVINESHRVISWNRIISLKGKKIKIMTAQLSILLTIVAIFTVLSVIAVVETNVKK